jgi:hypothetical protein
VSKWEDRIIHQNQNIAEIEEVDGVYGVISCYPEYPQTAVNLAAALTEWLGLNKDDITVVQQPGGDEPVGPWVEQTMGSPYPETGGFSAAQWEDVQSFYAAGGWEAWAADNNVQSSIKFTK